MKLEIENLTVGMEGKDILDDFNLELEYGNIYALMGKTVLVNQPSQMY